VNHTAPASRSHNRVSFRLRCSKADDLAAARQALGLSDKENGRKRTYGTNGGKQATDTDSASEAPRDETAPDMGVLWRKLAQAMQQSSWLAERWLGITDRLKDASRSGFDMSLGAMLKKRGFTYTEIRALLIENPHGAGREKAAEGDERYFERIWERSVAEEPEQGPTPTFLDPWNTLQPVPLHLQTLPGLLHEFVEDRARVIGADPGAIAWAAISACGASIDARVRLQMKAHDGWTVPPFIWIALVGDPSTKKTPILEAAWKPLRKAQSADIADWREEMARWKALPKKERAETPPVCRRRLITDNGTIEAIQEILTRQDRGLAVYHDELAGMIGSFDKYAGPRGAAADRAFYLQAYNGGGFTVDRVERGFSPIDNLCLTVVGGIQPERLRQFGDLMADGFLQRFAPIVVAPASLGTDEPANSAVADYAGLIERLLRIRPDTYIRLSMQAQEIGVSIEKKMLDLAQSNALGPAFGAFCGKLHGLWGRLCLVLSQIDPNPLAAFIVSEKTARQASDLLPHNLLPNAFRVYATMGGAGGDIAEFIFVKRKERIVPSDLTTSVRACRAQPLQKVQELLSPLVAGGWLTPEQEYNPTAWQVHPAVHEKFAERAAQERQRRAAIQDLVMSHETEGKSDE
jgi:hypothetical protein